MEVIAYKPHREDRNELAVSIRMQSWLSKENGHLIRTVIYSERRRFSGRASIRPVRKKPGNGTEMMMAIRRTVSEGSGRGKTGCRRANP
jgi:hypothetical protein